MKTKKFHAGVYIFLLLAMGDTTLSNIENIRAEYDEGFYFGCVARSLQESFDCLSVVKMYNDETGYERLIATTSFCNGYRKGRRSR